MMPSGGGGNPYTGLLNSGIYQQYLGQLLAANSAVAGGPGGPPHPLNPMLLQAQLAALAAQNSHHAHLMAAAAGYSNASSLISERLKAAAAHRFSPYPLLGSPPLSSPPVNAPMSSPSGLCGSASAFKALSSSRPLSAAAQSQHSPPVSPPHSGAASPLTSSSSPPGAAASAATIPPLLPIIKAEPITVTAALPSSLLSSSSPRPGEGRSEIKNIENMINGLNGTSEGRFGLSH